MSGETVTQNPVIASTWESYMLAGDFAKAWEVSDRVLRERKGQPCWDWPRHFQYIWNGEPLDGRDVFIRCYHGLGDTVQFLRYVPLVENLAREVTIWIQPALLPFAQSMHSRARFLPLHDGVPDVSYEVDVEIMELPHVFRSTLATLPSATPYLYAEPIPLGPTAGQQQPVLRVGLVWASGDWNPARSLSLAELAPLLAVRGVSWFPLQRGSARGEWPVKKGPLSGSDRIEELAGLMRSLDLVISVDSLPAHLAGALNVPVWTLLPRPPDWRWLSDGDRSPWYPSMRLFRQRTAGDWRAPVAEAVAALTAEVQAAGKRLSK